MVQGMAGFENVKIERDLSEPKRAEYQGPFKPIPSESTRTFADIKGPFTFTALTLSVKCIYLIQGQVETA